MVVEVITYRFALGDALVSYQWSYLVHVALAFVGFGRDYNTGGRQWPTAAA